MTIADNFARIRAEIAEICDKAGRPRSAVTLVAVSKTRPIEDVEAALAAGQRVFGENRVQEAAAKFAGPGGRRRDLELHLIGPLQTNKAADAVKLFDVIQTLDRPRLAEALATALKRPDARATRLLIQVNTGEEEQKAGVTPRDADAFIEDCVGRLGLPVAGLMCIPPIDDEPALHFALLRELGKRHGLPELSMGMSADYAKAIRQGATHVRIGTALFGERTR
jgi:pyridoxal phosphate enzyme (YggS family)